MSRDGTSWISSFIVRMSEKQLTKSFWLITAEPITAILQAAEEKHTNLKSLNENIFIDLFYDVPPTSIVDAAACIWPRLKSTIWTEHKSFLDGKVREESQVPIMCIFSLNNFLMISLVDAFLSDFVVFLRPACKWRRKQNNYYSFNNRKRFSFHTAEIFNAM